MHAVFVPFEQQDQTAEEKRRQHQKELADQLNKEALERIAEGKGFKQQEKRKKSEISYRKTSEVPREPRSRRTGYLSVSGAMATVRE